jgi:citronellyl-CoA dehydrogenase
VRFKLSELQTELECLRALVHKASMLYCEGEDVTYLASMCKLKAGRLAREVTDGCLQYVRLLPSSLLLSPPPSTVLK